jgi:hypothetical protein
MPKKNTQVPALLSLAFLLSACASRSVPAQPPPNSPLSLSAPAGQQVSVTRALSADPHGSEALPAPANAADGKSGESGSPAGHEHGGHHHGQ